MRDDPALQKLTNELAVLIAAKDAVQIHRPKTRESQKLFESLQKKTDKLKVLITAYQIEFGEYRSQ